MPSAEWLEPALAIAETREKVLKAEKLALRASLEELLLLIYHETDLPASAANGVTDESGMDEGIAWASETIARARRTLRDG